MLTAGIGIRQWMGNGFKSQAEMKQAEQKEFTEYNESRRERGMTLLDPPEDETPKDEKKA